MHRNTQHARTNSAALWHRARTLMPGGVSSPVRAFNAVGGSPVFIDHALGPHVFDVDGNSYIDLVGSWGPAIAGHAHPAVVEAVQQTAANGLSFGACCKLEADLAERIINAFSGTGLRPVSNILPHPSIEMLRFVSSGTEATMSALRLARATTNRSTFIKFAGHYHGHADPFLVSAGSGAATFGSPTSPGVPAAVAHDTIVAQFNDLPAITELMAKHGSTIAAIIVEPVAGNMGLVKPLPGFLEGLRTLCTAHGSLLIFDEVMTGFRVALGGYQTLAQISPDLTCLGKVIGGGMPVAAYAGPKHLMERLSPVGSVYQAGTLSGSPLAMAAGIATLKLCETSGFYDKLAKTSAALATGLREAAASEKIQLHTDSIGGMLGMSFTPKPVRTFADIQGGDHDRFARFFQAMLNRGVWLPPSHYEAMFVSAAHEQSHIDHILTAARESFKEIA